MQVDQTAPVTGGAALARQLRAEGVEVVFRLPGDQLMSALDKAKNLSASSEGPDDLAIERSAPARPDAPDAAPAPSAEPASAEPAGESPPA